MVKLKSGIKLVVELKFSQLCIDNILLWVSKQIKW